eukprot:TRINITY_DN3612_c0_g1_i4.p1 TRINITY_DN3612_c0_g1~~TRINITY_DN3612_c0_g1_i4.p1  ORF type:complete len:646 (-),score=203.82 TRINITY_DN3612_c0_g1_i4:64-1947(-)
MSKKANKKYEDDERPNQIGVWKLETLLGKGTSGTVWKGIHEDTEQVVAVKQILREKLHDKKEQENLDAEINIQYQLKHPNIVELFDRIETKEAIYIVMELCSGGDLAHFIKKRGKLSETTAQYFTRQLASGLRYIQSRNVIHRDLKPGNLLLVAKEEDTVMKMADFGFARYADASRMVETLCGTPLYMAPEILKGSGYTSKADLFSVGAILYEMVTGEPPYKATTLKELQSKKRKYLERLHTKGHDMSEECRDLIIKLLHPNPLERMSYEEFYEHEFVQLSNWEAEVDNSGGNGYGILATSISDDDMGSPSSGSSGSGKTVITVQEVTDAGIVFLDGTNEDGDKNDGQDQESSTTGVNGSPKTGTGSSGSYVPVQLVHKGSKSPKQPNVNPFKDGSGSSSGSGNLGNELRGGQLPSDDDELELHLTKVIQRVQCIVYLASQKKQRMQYPEALVLFHKAVIVLYELMIKVQRLFQTKSRKKASAGVKKAIKLMSDKFGIYQAKLEELKNVTRLSDNLVADELMYNYAIQLSQDAASNEMVYDDKPLAARLYTRAFLLFDQLLSECNEDVDRAVLLENLTVCNARLEFLTQKLKSTDDEEQLAEWSEYSTTVVKTQRQKEKEKQEQQQK